MSLSGGGRTPLNIKFFKEAIEKTEKVNFGWQEEWSWLIPEYLEIQRILAETNLPHPVKEIDPRSVKPFPNSVNHEYGWISTNPEFKLEKYGPDLMGFPLNIPKFDDI